MDEKTAIKLFALFLVSFISVNLNLSTISAASALNPEENSTITALLNELNASILCVILGFSLLLVRVLQAILVVMKLPNT